MKISFAKPYLVEGHVIAVMPADFDVVIIGGGHNGLTCGSYLAEAGVRTAIVERRSIVGGASVSEELWPGFRVSRASMLPAIHEKIVTDLQLDRFGYRVIELEPELFMPFPNGKCIFNYRNENAMAKEVARYSKADAERFPHFLAVARQFAEAVGELALSAPPSFQNFLSSLASKLDEEVLRYVFTMSCKDILEEYFECAELKALLCMKGVLNTSMSVDSVGTGYILLLALGGKRGYTYAPGGMGSTARALEASFRNRGGFIFTNSEVKKIIIKRETASGVELTSGKTISAKAIVSNADPKRTFLRLVEPGHLESGFVKKVISLNSKGTSFKLNLALSEPPDYLAYPGRTIGPQHKAMTYISPSLEYVIRAYEACARGLLPEKPPMNFLLETALDSSLAPSGKHVLSILTKYYPYQLTNGNWDELKQDAMERTLSVIEEYAPNIRKSVLHEDGLSPLDLERVFGLTNGNVTHLDQNLSQQLSFRPILGWSNYRTPIDGLYICGVGTSPGGGVNGIPGHNASRTILSDLMGSGSPVSEHGPHR